MNGGRSGGAVIAVYTSCIRNQVHAAPRERVAARNATQREPGATPRAMKPQCFGGILRAGGIEFAGARHQCGKERLVNAHEQDQPARGPAHFAGLDTAGGVLRTIPCSRRTNSVSSGAKGACATECRG